MNLLSNKPLVLGLCLVALLLGAALAHTQRTPKYTVSNATVLDFPRPVPPLALVDHLGDTFDNHRLNNTWSVVFFGFTHCPDVCPTTMSMLASTVKQIKSRHPEHTPQIIMISVDPARDTPDLLKAYVPFFSPDFVGVTGNEEQIHALTQNMGVAYSRVSTGPNQYTIDHTSALFVINPDGAVAAISSSPHQPAQLANDLLALALN